MMASTGVYIYGFAAGGVGNAGARGFPINLDMMASLHSPVKGDGKQM